VKKEQKNTINRYIKYILVDKKWIFSSIGVFIIGLLFLTQSRADPGGNQVHGSKNQQIILHKTDGSHITINQETDINHIRLFKIQLLKEKRSILDDAKPALGSMDDIKKIKIEKQFVTFGDGNPLNKELQKLAKITLGVKRSYIKNLKTYAELKSLLEKEQIMALETQVKVVNAHDLEGLNDSNLSIAEQKAAFGEWLYSRIYFDNLLGEFIQKQRSKVIYQMSKLEKDIPSLSVEK